MDFSTNDTEAKDKWIIEIVGKALLAKIDLMFLSQKMESRLGEFHPRPTLHSRLG